MYALEAMSSKLIVVHPDTLIVEAIRLMLENGISGLPVVSGDGELVGMITEGDLLRRPETATEKHRAGWRSFLMSTGQQAAEYAASHAQRVRDAMTTNVVSVGPTSFLGDVVDLMEKHKVKRVPVVRAGKLIGIVTRADLLKVLMSFLTVETTASDKKIHQRIADELARQPWAPQGMITFAVVDGVVNFSGTIMDDRLRDALRVAAENVPGVREIHDHLVFIEPMSGMVIDAPGEVMAGQ